MTDEQLTKAIELKKEIRELESFIRSASNVWQGKIIQKKQAYIFKAIPYGCLGGEEFIMKTPIKNRVLQVLKDYLSELKKELENI